MMRTQVIYSEPEIDLETVKASLAHAEEAIERAARNAFEEWGAQLKHIRENRLYIAFAPGCTWEEYCRDRWEKTSRWADQLISAFEIKSELTELIVHNNRTNSSQILLPGRETHIRPLSTLAKPEQRAEVWQRVIANVNGKGVTAAMVSAEVERYKAELEKNWITLTEWQTFEQDEKQRILTRSNITQKTMNKVNENIEWAMWSWNPITGCLHNCAYCYARDIANRFYPQNFEPSFLPDRLTSPGNTSIPDKRWNGDIGYKNVFTCSMADLFGKWVPQEWIGAVLQAINDNPQWTFLLLTKFPIRMAEFDYPPNVWLGTSVDYQWAVERAEKAFIKIKDRGFEGVCWLSCEPMMERLTFNSLSMFDWVVMGGSSKSSQTPEYRPPFEDIVHLHNQARNAGCKIYQKTNLIPGMDTVQRIREYPI